MRKITDFIIDKRYYVLGLFIILSIGCAILSQKVTINYDIAKYLPNTSETRILWKMNFQILILVILMLCLKI